MLIVSTDTDLLDLYVIAFRAARIAVLAVTERDDALELIARDAVSAIVVDVVAAADWRSCELFVAAAAGRIPITVLTGWVSADRRYRDKAMSIGCAAFVAKPATPEELHDIVRRTRGGEREVIRIRQSNS